MIERIQEGEPLFNTYELNSIGSPQREGEFEAMILESVLESKCIDEHFTDSSALIHHSDAWFESILPTETSLQSLPVVEKLSDSYQMSEKSEPLEEIEHPVSSVDTFVTSLWPYLKKASENIGLDPKILLAQAALETGWGACILKDAQGASSYNAFNIKSFDKNSPQFVVAKTTEYNDNKPFKLDAAFKSYQSYKESVQDYLSLIQGSARYQDAVAHADSPTHYVQALQKAGYATDPNYADKILSIYHGDVLQQALVRNGLV